MEEVQDGGSLQVLLPFVPSQEGRREELPYDLFSVIPAKVPRQARDPELVERAGIQELQ